MFNNINCILRNTVEFISLAATLILKLAIIGFLFIIEQWAEQYY